MTKWAVYLKELGSYKWKFQAELDASTPKKAVKAFQKFHHEVTGRNIPERYVDVREVIK